MDTEHGGAKRPKYALFIALIGALVGGCVDSKVSDLEQVSDNHSSTLESVVILTWEEYFSPDIVSLFEEETGISVEFRYFENLEEMRSLIESRPDEFDLIVADGSTLKSLIDLKLLHPLDRDLLDNFGNFDPKYLNLEFDPENRFTVPYMWGTTVIAYRNDLIPDPTRSWKILWDPRYKGRVSLLDDSYDTFAVSLLSLGYDANSDDADQLAEASRHLVDGAGKMNARFADIIEIRERLLAGDYWVSMAYSSDAAMLAEESADISYFIPDEGATLWLDSFGMPREAKNREQAHRFLNFLCRADIAAASSNYLWCATPNAAAKEFLEPEVLEDPVVYPDAATLERCSFLMQSGVERSQVVNNTMKLVYRSLNKMEAEQDSPLVRSEDADVE